MRTILKHTLESLISILLALLLIGVSESIIEVDVARTQLGTKASQKDVNVLKHQLGLDKSFFKRIISKIVRIGKGDLGTSYVYHKPVASLLKAALKSSLRLISPAIFLGGFLGIIMGIWVAYSPGEIKKYILLILSSMGLLPSIILSTLVVYGFGFKLGWFSPSFWSGVILLSLIPFSVISLTTFFEYSKILRSDDIRALKSYGFHGFYIILYSLKRFGIALTSNLTTLFLYLLTGTLFIEIIFSLSGLGNLLLNSAERFDYPIILGTSFLIILFFGLMNFISGVALYGFDPRTR
jgi:ABC-type dipeptide/oligopeptide/nickel transport system permease component